MLNKQKNLKLYYSTGEVAQMLGVNSSTLRFWEKEFPQLAPKRAGRDIRQYTEADIQKAKLIYHLVKERGMTIPGARQRLRDNGEATTRTFEVVSRLKAIRQELLDMRKALDSFTYDDVDALRQRLQSPPPSDDSPA